jgi:transcription-repair coupling factor (superfamily II helicase)
VVVTSIAALLQPVPSRTERDAGTRTIRIGDELDRDDFLRWLVDRGFERTGGVEVPGEFCVHGGILDVYPPDPEEPFRIEFFGDEIESIRRFHVETQRKTAELQEATFTLVAPVDTGPESTRTGECLLDSLPDGSWVALAELEEIVEEGKRYLERLGDRRGLFTVDAVLKRVAERPYVQLAAMSVAGLDVVCHLQTESIERFAGPKSAVLEELANVVAADEQVLIACHNEGERERLSELLAEQGTELADRVTLCVGRVAHGFRLALPSKPEAQAKGHAPRPSLARQALIREPYEAITTERTLVISDHELFGRTELRQVGKRKRKLETRAIDSFLDLRKGDLVVHLTHGIGRFRGMERLKKGEHEEEHLGIEFRDGIRVHVPVSLIHLVQKYVGAAKAVPQLSKLGGTAWSKRKQRAEAAVTDMASDMLRLQAAREAKPGIAFPPDTHWQQEFEASFPYVETDDQLHAIADFKDDMHRPRPMDRLICGDVGYGKTEVAMRAAFKCIEAGRQVAVLVPTTVLAEQHYRTFTERMAEYPFNVEVLSRFRTKKEQRQVLKQMETGGVDVVIGTHRIVQQDVRFKDLGLLIIDEEQRFGVEAKEMLKQLRLEVDVLTLSATPIPRTLHMSLLGVRDISNLTTAPQDRQAVETRVTRWDGELIRRAIVRELNRGGQIFFVHNRVYNIRWIADRIQEIVPEAKIGIGHGQMPGDDLEDAMHEFVAGRTDVLVCTTIIESGLDIPNANTIFINESGSFGLADLHQLRGRVGRYKHRAYCYLLLDDKKPITRNASKRLKAIEEYSELGAGFKIAMRDLEIRGAGNILGTEQSGHISAVGYELYCQLLENAVHKLKGEPVREHRHVQVDLPVSAFFPDAYIPPGRTRIQVYRKLSLVDTPDDLADLQTELEDRFGPIPLESQRLLRVKELQLAARKWQVENIHLEDGYAVFEFRKTGYLKQLKRISEADLRDVDDRTGYLPLPREFEPDGLLETLKSVLRQ